MGSRRSRRRRCLTIFAFGCKPSCFDGAVALTGDGEDEGGVVATHDDVEGQLSGLRARSARRSRKRTPAAPQPEPQAEPQAQEELYQQEVT